MPARRIVSLALCLLVFAPAAARADGDPASDVLLQQDAYYPYAPKTATRMRTALDALLSRARADGYPMKVALAQPPGALGASGSLFNSPQRYANQLAHELETIR